MLQPATKALAQMLAGNTKFSGQLVHARNILSQANRIVDERHVDRLPPAAREEFFEQLARLKLTITDAEEAGLGHDAQPDTPAPPAEPMAAERLREVARRLAAASAEPSQQVFAPPARFDDDEPDELPAETRSVQVGEADQVTGSRLRRSTSGTREPEAAPDASTANGPRRERLRLKPLRPVGADVDR